MTGLVYLYKMLSYGFFYPDEDYWEKIEKILGMGEDLLEGELLARAKDFEASFAESRDRMDEVRSEYLKIFDIGKAVSPYETGYIADKASRKTFELTDIAGFYQAFGLLPNERIRNKEVLDHISIELE